VSNKIENVEIVIKVLLTDKTISNIPTAVVATIAI
jgi:hypothetical protein